MCEPSYKETDLILMDLFASLDEDIQEFKEASRLDCPARCGYCCEGSEIETTVLEMMPLANYLWNAGETEVWFQKAVNGNPKGRCILYCSDEAKAGQGRCLFYAYRPLICRLFGFSAKQDKHARPVFVTCKVIKETQAECYTRIQKRIKEGMPVPAMASYAFQVSCLDIALGTKQWPINEAIRMALEKIGLSGVFQKQQNE